jgi:ribose transport system substrate-binding protein
LRHAPTARFTDENQMLSGPHHWVLNEEDKVSSPQRRTRKLPRLTAGALAGVLIACISASISGATTSGGSASKPIVYKYGYESAVAMLPKLYRGTFNPVNTTPRPAAKGKFVAIINGGQENPPLTVGAAQAAATAIGWKSSILEGTNNPSIYGGLISQAIADGANGIITDAIDCNIVRGPLEEAKQRHILVVAINSFDCNDPTERAGPPLYTAMIDYNDTTERHQYSDLTERGYQEYDESYGRAEADFVVANSHNKARILVLNDSEFTLLKYTAAGFDQQITHSRGSKVVATLDFEAADLGPKLQEEIEAQLLKHPDIDWIRSPYAAATTLGIVPAIRIYPKGRFGVMGGEGTPPELDDITAGTVTAALTDSSQWTGWAAVDAMNSVFTHKPVYPSGLGWQLIGANHSVGVSANGYFTPKLNFEAAYEKAWGVPR